ncbi:MAG: hypothetical protein IKO40_12865, partial [Kiritimatiellae bacterium]|nr:hypothetical protein [Kiritimatiellia bacterium]
SNLPLVVTEKRQDEKRQYIVEFREILQYAAFKEEDWARHFRMNDQWHDPAIRRIWMTSWDNLSRRWEGRLKDGRRDARENVRGQIRTIAESGRFDEAGGKTWRENIEKWWKANATNVAPRLKIYNYSNEARGVRLRWELVRGYSLVVPEFTLAERDVREISAPFQDIGPTGKITAVIQYFIPTNYCCGHVETKMVFDGPFADDQELILRNGENSWETSANTRIEVTVENIDGRSIQVKFVSEKQSYAMSPKLGYADVWSCGVPAHSEGSVEVYEGTTLLGKNDIVGSELHRGAKVKTNVTLQPVVRLPELIRQNELIFEGEKKENAILEVKIEKGYAVFNGDKAKFSNPEVLDGYEICKPGNVNIPMKATLVSGDDPPAVLQPLAARILHPRGESAWTGNATMVLDETPETTNSFIPIPQQTFYLGSWQTCRDFIKEEEDPLSRGKILKALSVAKQSWSNKISDYVNANGLLPKIRIWNKSGEEVYLALSGNNPVWMENGGHHEVEIDPRRNLQLRVRKIQQNGEVPSDGEYVNNDILSKIQHMPQEWGEIYEYSIKADDIRLRSAPSLVLSWPADLIVEEIKLKEGETEETVIPSDGQIETVEHTNGDRKRVRIDLHRGKRIDKLSVSFKGYERYWPEIPQKDRYRISQYGDEEMKIFISAEKLVEKPQPDPVGPVIVVNDNDIKRLKKTLQDALLSLENGRSVEKATKNIEESMPSSNTPNGKRMKTLIERKLKNGNDMKNAAREVLLNDLNVNPDVVFEIWKW